jgi:hypothetical protein
VFRVEIPPIIFVSLRVFCVIKQNECYDYTLDFTYSAISQGRLNTIVIKKKRKEVPIFLDYDKVTFVLFF